MTNRHTISADALADYLLHSVRSAGDALSNLKLQKLAYYAQAWRMTLVGKPLIGEPFEAWIHGPVCPPLYHRFKRFGWNSIDEVVHKPKLDPPVEEHLRDVLNSYGGFTAWELERLVHSEDPWRLARGALASDAPSNAEIPLESMRAYYASKLREQ